MEVRGHHLSFHTTQGVIRQRDSLRNWEAKLEGLPFERCNNSYLVNLKQVTAVAKDSVQVGCDWAANQPNQKETVYERTHRIHGRHQRMIDHAWLQVSYMAQIIVACLLFMIPVAKRRRFPARFASCTIVLLMIAYMFGAAVTVPDNLLLAILYWPAIRGHMPSRSGVVSAGGLSEVLYCTICANATQHAANECYLALSIALGRTTPICPRSSTDC